jgi:hypothetical protein
LKNQHRSPKEPPQLGKPKKFDFNHIFIFVDYTKRELSPDLEEVRDSNTPAKLSSTSKTVLIASHPSSTTESALHTSGNQKTQLQVPTTNADGVKLLPATATTVLSALSSSRTSHLVLWVPLLELCSTPTSRSEDCELRMNTRSSVA